MVCTFFGHKDSSSLLKERLEKTILELVSLGTNVFLVGNNGNFDYMTQHALAKIQKSKPEITVRIVLSYIEEKPISGFSELTVYPEELVCVPKRLAISKRNDYMLKRADVVIANVTSIATNSYKWLEKAQKANKQIINLA